MKTKVLISVNTGGGVIDLYIKKLPVLTVRKEAVDDTIDDG